MIAQMYTRWLAAKKGYRSRRLSPRLKETFSRYNTPYKIHLGCGSVKLQGWINVDLHANPHVADAEWDITQQFPLVEECCSHIYSEHVMEHFSPEEASRIFRECHRLLIKGGMLRVAMPSLASLVDAYCSAEWKGQDWLGEPESAGILTRAEMLNVAFRSWGHKWLYDEEELARRLSEAGFEKSIMVGWCDSADPHMRGLERRKDSKLICDARKGGEAGGR